MTTKLFDSAIVGSGEQALDFIGNILESLSPKAWRDPSAALALGANKFMLRPIDPQDLVSEIEACLQDRREK